ncbi:unnamed protein product [Mytilus coruscus]|uniref:Uncharacterized protein n=1 Tax=Mytilus coruscus TaxID=42192 RepID=A0A6J8AV21_MYTCO|nr:unnamed protein product [Mytilus coruscus]
MSSFPVMIAGHSQAKGKYFDQAPYKRALLTTPIPALPPAPKAFYFEDKKNLVLVHYEGDEKVYTPLTHGNRTERDNAPEYIRTNRSVLKAIEKVVQTGDKTAMEVYRDSISNSDIPGVQVENIVRKVNEQKRISKDEIYNLLLVAYHMEGYIQEITMFPDLTSKKALPEMISIVNQLLDVNTEDDQPFLFFYDTTFKLGDFYVSPLVFRNIIFEDRPIMPVAFLIHGRKKKRFNRNFSILCHQCFQS